MLLAKCVFLFVAVDCYKIIVLHHSNVTWDLEETDKEGNPCPNPGSKECQGGLPRISTLVKHLRQEAEKKKDHLIYVMQEDFYKTNDFDTNDKNNGIIQILNHLKPDVFVSIFLSLKTHKKPKIKL